MKAKILALAAASAFLITNPITAAVHSKAKSAKATTPTRKAWTKVTLSGKITMVDPTQKLLVVQDSTGVPFDLKITPETRIESSTNQGLKLNDLTQQTNKTVSVTLVPERSGDIAQSIHITG